MNEDAPTPPPDPDPGLRRLLTWTAIALIGAMLFAVVAVAITIRLLGG